jgi:hypothetical protein
MFTRFQGFSSPGSVTCLLGWSDWTVAIATRCTSGSCLAGLLSLLAVEQAVRITAADAAATDADPINVKSGFMIIQVG